MTKSRGTILSLCHKPLDVERNGNVPSAGTAGSSSAGEQQQPSVKVLPFYRGQFDVARNKDLIFVLKDFFPGKL